MHHWGLRRRYGVPKPDRIEEPDTQMVKLARDPLYEFAKLAIDEAP